LGTASLCARLVLASPLHLSTSATEGNIYSMLQLCYVQYKNATESVCSPHAYYALLHDRHAPPLSSQLRWSAKKKKKQPAKKQPAEKKKPACSHLSTVSRQEASASSTAAVSGCCMPSEWLLIAKACLSTGSARCCRP